MTRVLTGLILVPFAAYVIFFGPLYLFQAVVALLAFFCFREFANITHAQNIPLPTVIGHAIGLAWLFLPQPDWMILLAVALFAAVWSIRAPDLAQSLPQAGALLLGILYIYGAWRCAFLLRQSSAWWIFFAVSINWVGDSAAMYAGKAFGKHKLAPVVSPKKTWEGAIASTLCCALYGAILLPRVFPAMSIPAALAVAVTACIAGQIGDLAESAFKRGANIKDSGTMLPGHGGWLDRLDSTLFSIPTVAFYLRLTGAI